MKKMGLIHLTSQHLELCLILSLDLRGASHPTLPSNRLKFLYWPRHIGQIGSAGSRVLLVSDV